MAVYQWLDETTNGTGVVSQLAYVDDCTEEGIHVVLVQRIRRLRNGWIRLSLPLHWFQSAWPGSPQTAGTSEG